MGSRRCELCKTGKVRPMQLSLSRAIMICDNSDCDYLFNSSPRDNIIFRNLSMHSLETPIGAESWIRASNSCSSSSGVHSDIKSPVFSRSSSLASITDKEVEFVLQKSYAPPRVSGSSQNNVLGPSSWKKSGVRGPREHGRNSTKLGKRSGQVASALTITTAFDLPNEGVVAPRHSDSGPGGDAEMEAVAKNEFFDMLNELDLDTPPVNKNHSPSDNDIGDLPPLDPWMKEEYRSSQSEVGSLGNIKSFQGPHEGSGSYKGDVKRISEPGVPFIPSAGSAFSQVPPSKVMTSSCLALEKEDVNSDSLLQDRGCEVESREELETGDLSYAGALLADTASPASSHGSEDSGYNEECRIPVGLQKPLSMEEHTGTRTQVLITKDSRGLSFSNVEEEVYATNIKESSHPEEVIKYLMKPVTMANMINILEYNVLPAVVSPNNIEKSVDNEQRSTNVLEAPLGNVESCFSQDSLGNTEEPSSSGHVSQLKEDTVANVTLQSPHNTHSLLKQKSLESKASETTDSEISVTHTQNGISLTDAPIEQNHTKPSISSEVRKEYLEIGNKEPVTSQYNIECDEIGESEESSSHFITKPTSQCDTIQRSEVLQLPSISEWAGKFDVANNVIEGMLVEDQHDILNNIVIKTESGENVVARNVQESYGLLHHSEKDKTSIICDQIENSPLVSENVSRVSSDGDSFINMRKSSSPPERINQQDSVSPSSELGSIDKTSCTQKAQPIKRGPGRPRGRGRPKNKNKSVPSTDTATSRGAPTTAKVGPPSVGYVRESRSRKRRNLETRAYHIPKEEDWEDNNDSDNGDIRKGISELLPSSYLQLTRGRKNSRWSGGAKTATYNISSEDEADVDELHVEVMVEGHRNFDLPLYLQQHLKNRRQRDKKTAENSQVQQKQVQDDKSQGKSKCSRKYFEDVLANVDFDEQFFQCPTKEHDRDGSSLDELSDGVLLFGQTGEEHSLDFMEIPKLTCDAAKGSLLTESPGSDVGGVGNSYFPPVPGYGLVEQEMTIKQGASCELAETEETCMERAAESLLMLAIRGHNSGMCEEQVFSEASQNEQFNVGYEEILSGRNLPLNSGDNNSKTQAEVLSCGDKSIRELECVKLGSDSKTADGGDGEHRKVLALHGTVSSFSHLNQPSLCDQYPYPVQLGQSLTVIDEPHDVAQEKQIVQSKEDRQKAKELICDVPKNEMHTGEGESSVTFLNRIDLENIQVNTHKIIPSFAPSTEEGTMGRSDKECTIETTAGSSRKEPIFSINENQNRLVRDCLEGTSEKIEYLHSSGNHSSASDSHQNSVQMCLITAHTPERHAHSSSTCETPSCCDDSDNDLPTFTLDDMDEIHVLVSKKRKKNGRMGEEPDCKKIKTEVAEDAADCSMVHIDFDEVPLCCGILDDTFVHEECCALRNPEVNSSVGKNDSTSGQKLFGICYARKSTKRISNEHSSRLETFLNLEIDKKPVAVASPLVIDAHVKDKEQAEKRVMEEEAAYGDVKHSPQFHGLWSPDSESSQPGILDLDVSLSTIEPFTDMFSWSPESEEITDNTDKQEMVGESESHLDVSAKGIISRAQGSGTTNVMVSSHDTSAKAREFQAKGSSSRDLIKPGIGQLNVAVTKGPGKVLKEDTWQEQIVPHTSHEGTLSSEVGATPSVYNIAPYTSFDLPSISCADTLPAPTPYSQVVHLYPHDSGSVQNVAQMSGTSLTFSDHMLFPRVPQVSTTDLIGIDCRDVFQLEPTTIVPPALLSSYCSPKPGRESWGVRRGQSQWALVKPITVVDKVLSNNRSECAQPTRKNENTLPLTALKTKVTKTLRETLSESSGESLPTCFGERSVSKSIKEVHVPVSTRKFLGESSKTAGEPFAASTSKFGQQRRISSAAKEVIVNPGSKSCIHSTNRLKVDADLPKTTKLPKTNPPHAEPVQGLLINNTFFIKAPSGSEPKTMKSILRGSDQMSQSAASPVIVTQSAIPSQVTLEETIRKPLTGIDSQGKGGLDRHSALLSQKALASVSSDVSKVHFLSQNTAGTSQIHVPALSSGARSASNIGNQPFVPSPASSSSLLGSSTILNSPSVPKTSNMAGVSGNIGSEVADKIGELCQNTSNDAPNFILVSVGDKKFRYRLEDK
ncbi:uncharacterized protein LOC143034051 isoform X2 [Oratosquilla oratoria]